jgi:hypothetical protein
LTLDHASETTIGVRKILELAERNGITVGVALTEGHVTETNVVAKKVLALVERNILFVTSINCRPNFYAR